MKVIHQSISLLARRICPCRALGIGSFVSGLGRGDEVSREVAWSDDVHAHAERRDLLRENFRERVECRLGAAVCAQRWEAREACNRGDIQDVTGVLCAECGEEGLNERDGAEDVRLVLRADVLGPVLARLDSILKKPTRRRGRTVTLLKCQAGHILRC